ncbi:putative spermidine/putrescine transport system permease protein [Bradyrhizobium japonicum]|jgi:putative spermidine/putrescine transport system permease protein|uniref:ABC transporter permease n=1 Tax=Bradyrhizobium TaxID=374 RepID=UPI0004B5F2FF|nr:MULTISPECIES: ABC transporter permease [Bradyrhizobium]MBR0883060.1 ABC transporter permease [Bradyrhizobium liaoningense]MBR0946695.1 ABC transporter permease [Bradyrhizobium liaoningense]MBR1032284.1 ABC transporter permease [Bradyrhizobium liaoningense]MBR1069322.1 ABC transporter permease [Bradyrhizobium liaoningense]MCP1780959.1 putative spermidine/putrescine transport system permease protein [Bradyrhizobium japonicum]
MSSPADQLTPSPSRPGFGVTARYWLLILPALALMIVCYVYPISKVLWLSVTEPQPGLDNYAMLATSASIQRMLATTARISVISTLITLVLGYIVSYALVHASERVRRWMFLGVLVPLWISVLVRAFAWFVLLRREGLINNILISSGLVDAPLSLIWNETGVLIGMVHYMLPFGILPIHANMRDIDQRCVAAARGLGASRAVAFRQVFLPLSMPGVVGASILVFIFSLGFFVTPAILGGGKTLMIAEYIKVQILEIVRWGVGSMLAGTLLIIIGGLLVALARVVDLRKLFGSI